MSLPKKDEKYTYADYLAWSNDERWEIIDGKAYMLATPTWEHQAILTELARQFANYLHDKPCKAFVSPFDLRLPEEGEKDEDVMNVLQPDLVIVCDIKGLKGTGYYGSPDLIVEVTSPSTSRNDRLLKFNKYEKAGVREYWIADPDGKFISVFTLQENDRYGRPELYSENSKIMTSIFPDCIIDLEPVFAGI